MVSLRWSDLGWVVMSILTSPYQYLSVPISPYQSPHRGETLLITNYSLLIYFVPVEPKPPAPRSVSSSTSTESHSTFS